MIPRPAAAFLRDRRAVAATEAVLAASIVLIPLCLGAIDYAALLGDEARLDRALQSATYYVWNNMAAFTTSGIQAAAGAGYGTGSPTLTVTATTACYCVSSGYSKGASVSCTGSCTTGQQVATYATITAAATFTLPVAAPYLASSQTRSVSGTIRTQ